MKNKSLLLFDIDGTLINTEGRGAMAFNKAAETAFGVKNGTTHFNFAGATDSGLINQFLTNHNLETSRENLNQFIDAYVFWLDYFLTGSESSPYPGLESLLSTLVNQNPNLTLGLLTGNARLGAEIKLRHYGIWHYFSVGGFGCEHPDRNELAVRLVQSLGADDLTEIALVGDTLNDLNAAKAIGAKFIGFCSGKISRREFLLNDADLAIGTYDEFPLEWFSAL